MCFSEEEYIEFKSLSKKSIELMWGDNRFEEGNLSDLLLNLLKDYIASHEEPKTQGIPGLEPETKNQVYLTGYIAGRKDQCETTAKEIEELARQYKQTATSLSLNLTLAPDLTPICA